MPSPRHLRGFTLLELALTVMVAVVVLISALSFVPATIRANTAWIQGRFVVAPQTVAWSPARPSFVFEVRSGVGVDQHGQPATAGRPLAGRALNFTLLGSGGDSGVIRNLNSSAVDATSGAEPSDPAGIVAVQVEVDDDGPYLITVTDPASGASERHIFVAGP